MKPSIKKLQNIFKLEADKGYPNNAVIGGLEKFLDHWVGEARAEGISEDLIQLVLDRIHNYPRLTPTSRAETLQGLLRRMQRGEDPVMNLPPAPPMAGTQLTQEKNKPKSKKPERREKNKVEREPIAVAQPGPARNDEPASVDDDWRPAIIQSDEPQPPIRTRLQPYSGPPAALTAPVTVLNGVGPAHAKTLARLGLFTLGDLLYYFPRRYDDYSKLLPINRLTFGDEVTVIATVQSVASRPQHGGKSKLVEAVVSDGTGAMRLVWFNPNIARRVRAGKHMSISGRVEQFLGRPVMNNPEIEDLDQQLLNTNRIVPIYPLTAQITNRWLRKVMREVVTFWAPRVQDPLPNDVRRSAGLTELSHALLQMHFPDTLDDLKASRSRLAFDEIFLMQMGVLRQKRAWQEKNARIFETPVEWLQAQVKRLPYQLTGAQQGAIRDVQADLASGHPMNRLLQGDVGSGKTVIAALAIAMIINHGSQAALMAPTGILAEQHYRGLLEMLAERKLVDEEIAEAILIPEQIRLMVGSTPEAEKREIRAGLENGEIKVLVGTHALIEDPVVFADLELVVIDEQHRFGVDQRAALRAKGDSPHLLVMTATPIPRSLALTVYGDLDLTVMDEMPAGRQPVGTHILAPRERERAYSLIRSQVESGRQAIIIYPLVEESEKSETRAAVEEHARLQTQIFPKLKLGLLHGRMPPEEKDEVMQGFRNGEYHILVSTSVIEVGVDVPNATVMLIEGANRFGLAQLHQFRGRVGRGGDRSYCLLVPDMPDALENERLQVMIETNDGFVLAERDLVQRGPGQFLGTRQSGFTELRLANLADVRLIETARKQAQSVFQADPDLTQPRHQPLEVALQRFWRGTEGPVKADIS